MPVAKCFRVGDLGYPYLFASVLGQAYSRLKASVLGQVRAFASVLGYAIAFTSDYAIAGVP